MKIVEFVNSMRRANTWLLGMVAAVLVVGGTCGTASDGNKVTYFHNDLLGSPVMATDEQANVLWREDYKPYGEKTQKAPASLNDVGYTGHQNEDDLGLVYMQQRYYDPLLGRFLSNDPVGFSSGNVQSFNRYAYANDNPYKYVDPDGNSSKVATLIRLTSNQMKNLARLTKEQAVNARKAGDNVRADSRQVAKQIETAAHGKDDLLKHDGHELPDGSKGNPHYQTDGVKGHTFWGVAAAVLTAGAEVLDTTAEAAEVIDPTTYISSGDTYVDKDGNPVNLDEVYKRNQPSESESPSKADETDEK